MPRRLNFPPSPIVLVVNRTQRGPVGAGRVGLSGEFCYGWTIHADFSFLHTFLGWVRSKGLGPPCPQQRDTLCPRWWLRRGWVGLWGGSSHSSRCEKECRCTTGLICLSHLCHLSLCYLHTKEARRRGTRQRMQGRQEDVPGRKEEMLPHCAVKKK